MAIHFVNASLLVLFLVSPLPFIHSLSTVAISESADQTRVCAIARGINYSQQPFSFLNCMSFPQRIQFSISPPFATLTGVVGGNGFLCALSSFYSSSSSSSVMVCRRFSTVGNDIAYKRIYFSALLTDLASGNSHICGLVNGSHSLQCWQWKDFNHTANVFSSSLAVGDSFLCGLSDLGQVKCLGSPANITDHVPIGNFSQVKVGLRHACAVSLNGGLECWGDLAGDVPQGEFTTLALGENRSCAIRPNGTVICWGEHGFSLPESLRDESFVALEAKRRIFCGVVTSNTSLFCWGNEDFDSNPLVFTDVVPGPCINREECACSPLINYSSYCARGLIICSPCVQQGGGTSPPPAPPPWPPAPPPTVTPPPWPPAPPPTVTPPPPSRAKSGKTWDGKMVAYVVAGSVGSFLSLLALGMFLFSRRFKITSSRIHDSGRLEEGGSPQQSGVIAQPQPTTRVMEKNLSHLISMGQLEQFSLEVLIEATENFSEDHKIGTGGFGSVYRATLEDNRQVAIKRAEASASSSRAGADKCGLEDRDSAFVNELEFLSRLNHKNLVRLFGYCTDCNERVLVYEYMDNGTLSDHLHKLQTSPSMSWPTRIKVALDAARGIEYLHEYAMPRVIHRDIKPSNILLDTTWTAKVSDFGLSLMGPQDEEDHLSLRAAGTMGYMDPEYYRLQMLTTKSDVYSFGVVLLELLSGYKAIHKNENGVPRNVVDYVVPYITQDEIHRALDRRIPPPTPFEIEAVSYVGYLAADCVMPEGRDRPTMSEVVNSLVKALDACLAPPVLSRSTTASSTLS